MSRETPWPIGPYPLRAEGGSAAPCFTVSSHFVHREITRVGASFVTVSVHVMEAAASPEEVLSIGPVEIRPQGGLVTLNRRTVMLSVREFSLLVAMGRKAGRVVTRGELYELVWGAPLRAGDRSVDVYVHKLRAKLEAGAPGWTFIHTHVGFGYRFAPEPSHDFNTSATAG